MIYYNKCDWMIPEIGEYFDVLTEKGEMHTVKCVASDGDSSSIRKESPSCEDCVFCLKCGIDGDFNATNLICHSSERPDGKDVKFVIA